jgi:hypothetical protein
MRTYPGGTDDADEEYPGASKTEDRRLSPLATEETCVSEGWLRESSDNVKACRGGFGRTSK